VIQIFVIVKIATCLLSVVLATAIISRDPGLRITRLMATIPLLTAIWSFGEIMWSMQPDSEAAAFWIRFTSISWMFLGPFCLHVFDELTTGTRPLVRRLLPISYLASGLSATIYNLTPLGVIDAVPTVWGWNSEFGVLFLALYLTAVAPIFYVLGSWSQVVLRAGSRGERTVWISVYAGVLSGLTVSTVTEVGPRLSIPALRLFAPCAGSLCKGDPSDPRRRGTAVAPQWSDPHRERCVLPHGRCIGGPRPQRTGFSLRSRAVTCGRPPEGTCPFRSSHLYRCAHQGSDLIDSSLSNPGQRRRDGIRDSRSARSVGSARQSRDLRAIGHSRRTLG